MDVSTATTIIRDRLGEETAYADFWSDAEILRALNEGQRRFCAEEKWPWLYTTSTGTITADDTTLTLQTGISFPRHWNLLLTADGQTQPYLPRKVSPVEGFQLRATYYNAAARIQWVYVESTEQAGNDPDSEYDMTIRLVPTPNLDQDYDFQYIKQPNTLTATNDIIDVPDEFCQGVVAYACHLLWKKELSWSQKAEECAAEYAYVVDQARKDLRRAAPDEELAWGRNMPEWYGPQTVRDYVLHRIPDTLGE